MGGAPPLVGADLASPLTCRPPPAPTPPVCRYGCLVVNAPTANTVAAAEHGIALLTALARNVAQADASVKAGKWDRNKYVGVSVVGKTLAIIGFGKVGGEVARRAKGLGMTVISYDPYASAEKAAASGVELVSLDEALSRGNFFSLHMPLTPQTKHLFNDDVFAKVGGAGGPAGALDWGCVVWQGRGRDYVLKVASGPPATASHSAPETACCIGGRWWCCDCHAALPWVPLTHPALP